MDCVSFVQYRNNVLSIEHLSIEKIYLLDGPEIPMTLHKNS